MSLDSLRHWIDKFQLQLGIFLVVSSLVAIVVSFISNDRYHEVAESNKRLTEANERRLTCQLEYDRRNNVRNQALTVVTDREREADWAADDAERTLFTDPALNKSDRTTAEQARIAAKFRAYQVALDNRSVQRAAAEKVRSENPVLPNPSCG